MKTFLDGSPVPAGYLDRLKRLFDAALDLEEMLTPDDLDLVERDIYRKRKEADGGQRTDH